MTVVTAICTDERRHEYVDVTEYHPVGEPNEHGAQRETSTVILFCKRCAHAMTLADAVAASKRAPGPVQQAEVALPV